MAVSVLRSQRRNEISVLEFHKYDRRANEIPFSANLGPDVDSELHVPNLVDFGIAALYGVGSFNPLFFRIPRFKILYERHYDRGRGLLQ